MRMAVGDEVPSELSVDPTLAQVFATWNDAGHWVTALDDQWRYVGIGDELTASGTELVIGEFQFGLVNMGVFLEGRAGTSSVEE